MTDVEIRKKQLDEAISEAFRFIASATAFRKELDKATYMFGSRKSGAMKRASMDLARILVPLRKSPFDDPRHETNVRKTK
jgi:hypothetical protein